MEDLRRHFQDVVPNGCLQNLETKQNRNGRIHKDVVLHIKECAYNRVCCEIQYQRSREPNNLSSFFSNYF